MSWRPSFDPRWFALSSVFSLFALVIIPTGDPAWLGFLGFLGSLGFLNCGNAKSQSA
jgi:hypothetical protein